MIQRSCITMEIELQTNAAFLIRLPCAFKYNDTNHRTAIKMNFDLILPYSPQTLQQGFANYPMLFYRFRIQSRRMFRI